MEGGGGFSEFVSAQIQFPATRSQQPKWHLFLFLLETDVTELNRTAGMFQKGHRVKGWNRRCRGNSCHVSISGLYLQRGQQEACAVLAEHRYGVDCDLLIAQNRPRVVSQKAGYKLQTKLVYQIAAKSKPNRVWESDPLGSAEFLSNAQECCL